MDDAEQEKNARKMEEALAAMAQARKDRESSLRADGGLQTIDAGNGMELFVIHFDADLVRAQLEVSRSAEKRRGSFEQNYSIQYLRQDLPADVREKLILNADEDGFNFDIDPQSQIDEDKIPVGLWIVGDQGIYMMTNGVELDKPKDARIPVAYAKECDPEKMDFDDWYDRKRMIFGGDDGVIFVPEEMIAQTLKTCGATLVVGLCAEGFMIRQKAQNATPDTPEAPEA